VRRRARKKKGAKALPALWLFTDPERTPDIEGLMAAMPRGSGVVYRSFGRPDAVEEGARLVRAARRLGLVLLVGADANLARRLRADGVHLPERAVAAARRLKNRRQIITAAAHSRRALALAGEAGVDLAFVSAVFPSNSPSAGRPLGPVRLARLVAGARAPVAALGGVSARTAARLRSTGVAGLAAIEGFYGIRPDRVRT
jgi:thiamine-phosphate pyrophosphorylase